MDVLKKKISTFRGDGGRVRITDDGLLMEILSAWEEWSGPQKEFYRAIGVSHFLKENSFMGPVEGLSGLRKVGPPILFLFLEKGPK